MNNRLKNLGINKIVIASTNKAKIKQLKNFSFFEGLEIICASDVNLGEIDETEDTLEGNALIKARSCYQHTGLPSLSDDTGFFVKSLDGFPGIHCGRIAGDSGNRDFHKAATIINDKLGKSEDRTAIFSSVLAFVINENREYIAKGGMNGTFVYPARNSDNIVDNGGYNTYFIPEFSNLTYAQSGITSNSIVTHRSRAIDDLIKQLISVKN